ncbi:transposase [Mesorhizobium sp. USDA 4775]
MSRRSLTAVPVSYRCINPLITLQCRSDSAKGFEVLPRRWVVERTFAWLGRCRRLAKDFERSIESAQAWVFIANIRMLTRRLART